MLTSIYWVNTLEIQDLRQMLQNTKREIPNE